MGLVVEVGQRVADLEAGFGIGGDDAVDEGAEALGEVGPGLAEVNQRIELDARVDVAAGIDHVADVADGEAIGLGGVGVEIVDHVTDDVLVVERKAGNLLGPADVVGAERLGEAPRFFDQRRLGPRDDVDPDVDAFAGGGVGEGGEIVPIGLAVPNEIEVGVGGHRLEGGEVGIDVDVTVGAANLAGEVAEDGLAGGGDGAGGECGREGQQQGKGGQ